MLKGGSGGCDVNKKPEGDRSRLQGWNSFNEFGALKGLSLSLAFYSHHRAEPLRGEWTPLLKPKQPPSEVWCLKRG